MVFVQEFFFARNQEAPLTIFSVCHTLLDDLDGKRTLPVSPLTEGNFDLMTQSHELVHEVLANPLRQNLLQVVGINFSLANPPSHGNLRRGCLFPPFMNRIVNLLQQFDLRGIITDERLLFGERATYSSLFHRFASGAVIKTTKITPEFPLEDFEVKYGEDWLLLFTVQPDGRLGIATLDSDEQLAEGQTVIALVKPPAES